MRWDHTDDNHIIPFNVGFSDLLGQLANFLIAFIINCDNAWQISHCKVKALGPADLGDDRFTDNIITLIVQFYNSTLKILLVSADLLLSPQLVSHRELWIMVFRVVDDVQLRGPFCDGALSLWKALKTNDCLDKGTFP